VLNQRSPYWWKTLVQSKLYMGARLGELLGLQWRRVDFVAETITVFHSTSKSKRSRTYPNCGSLLAILCQWWNAAKPAPESDDHVWPWSQDYRNLYKDWTRILQHAGLPTGKERRHRLKDFRSTAATQMIEAGESTLVVRDWLGHSSVRVTEAYYANTDKARRDAAWRRKVAG
jgi:integrase